MPRIFSIVKTPEHSNAKVQEITVSLCMNLLTDHEQHA